MIYLDHAATTPLDPRVYEAMLPHLRKTWGNPSSPHEKGREARAVIDESRQTIARHAGCKSHEIIFVSSGSEANSLALFGTCAQWRATHGTPGHVVLLSIEHSCSLKAVDRLQTQGWDVSLLPVNSEGRLAPETLQSALRNDTALVSIQWANNEVGTIQDMDTIIGICSEAGVRLHSDAVQAAGQLPLTPLPDLTSLAAHKFYGPKGIGVLIVREGVHLKAQILGGGQEFDLRAGTENTPAIAGLAKALDIAEKERTEEAARLTRLRDDAIAALTALPGISLNGPRGDTRLPNNINVRVEGIDAETLVMQLDLEGICISTGSACVTGANEPSHVLRAMGRSERAANENLRITSGRWTTAEELEQTVAVLKRLVER